MIDSGLLQARDPQWRALRARHGQLGIVVRCLIPRGEIQRVNRTTVQVRPDDDEGLLRALGLLEASLRA